MAENTSLARISERGTYNTALAIVLLMVASGVYAVGTWGGGEPPYPDDYVVGGSLWLFPIIAAMLLFACMHAGKTLVAGVIFLVGATAAHWFGTTVGWIVALAFSFYLYRRVFFVPRTRDQYDSKERPPAPTREEEPSTRTERDRGDRSAEVQRIAALRARIDREAKNIDQPRM